MNERIHERREGGSEPALWICVPVVWTWFSVVDSVSLVPSAKTVGLQNAGAEWRGFCFVLFRFEIDFLTVQTGKLRPRVGTELPRVSQLGPGLSPISLHIGTPTDICPPSTDLCSGRDDGESSGAVTARVRQLVAWLLCRIIEVPQPHGSCSKLSTRLDFRIRSTGI